MYGCEGVKEQCRDSTAHNHKVDIGMVVYMYRQHKAYNDYTSNPTPSLLHHDGGVLVNAGMAILVFVPV